MIKTGKMKKIPKAGELTWLLGTILVALGVSLCKKADLGVSMIAAPPFIIFEAIASFWEGFSVGMVEYMVQGVLLIFLCAAVQRINWRYLLAFVAAVIYGYTLDLWLLIFGSEPFDLLWVRWVMLFVGDTITAFGVACFFRTYLPLQVYELVVAEVADRYRFPVNKTKWIYDISSLVVSLILALSIFGDVATFAWSKIYMTSYHSIGLGTIITTIINAPIIAFWGKLLDRTMHFEPLFPRVYRLLARNQNKNANKGVLNEVPESVDVSAPDTDITDDETDMANIETRISDTYTESVRTESGEVNELFKP